MGARNLKILALALVALAIILLVTVRRGANVVLPSESLSSQGQSTETAQSGEVARRELRTSDWLRQ